MLLMKSSAGKSYMTEGLKKKGWVVIGSDDFSSPSEMKIPSVLIHVEHRVANMKSKSFH